MNHLCIIFQIYKKRWMKKTCLMHLQENNILLMKAHKHPFHPLFVKTRVWFWNIVGTWIVEKVVKTLSMILVAMCIVKVLYQLKELWGFFLYNQLDERFITGSRYRYYTYGETSEGGQWLFQHISFDHVFREHNIAVV